MWLLKLVSYLPLSVLFRFSDFLYFVVYRVVGYRKKMVRKNLINSFPEKTEQERIAIEKAYYKNLCDYGVETIKLLTIDLDELKTRMRYLNPEVINQYYAKNTPVILLYSHYFNWEWLGLSGCMWLDAGIDFIYQPVKNSLINNLLLAIRMRLNAYPIERNNTAREMIRRKDIVRGTLLIADQFPGQGGDKRFYLNFLNQNTAFFYACQQIPIMTQYPAIYHAIKKIKRGYYTCELIEVGKPPYASTDESVIRGYAREVEKSIRQDPTLWLWSHNRWKNR